MLAIVAGCVSSGTSGPSEPLPQPVAQQSSTSNETRNRARIHTDLGVAYFEDKNMGTALDEARIAISIDSNYPLAYNLLGLVYLEIKEYAQAERAFQQALSLAPNDPDISNNYGWFLCETKNYTKALSYFDIAMRNPLYSAPALAMNNAAICSSRTGNDAAAENYLIKAIRLDPNNQRGLYLLSDLYYRAGRYSEARLRLGDFHRRSEVTAASAWLGLKIARKMGDRNDEARFLAQLRQRFPDSNESALLAQGRFE